MFKRDRTILTPQTTEFRKKGEILRLKCRFLLKSKGFS